jgi:glycosyltransferase involved in cell wall biosynthesis
VSNSPEPQAEIAALRHKLEAEEERRRSRERELVEQTARTRDAEARLDQVRQTMAFGLGQALVDALKPAGLVRLPARVIELRRRQKEKRGWQTVHAVEQRPAHELRLVTPALAIAGDKGAPAAADWIEGRARGARREKARALAELALEEIARSPDIAAAMGRRALALATDEARIAAIAVRLHDAGAIRAPRDLLSGLDAAVLTPAMAELREALVAAGAVLDAGLVIPGPGARAEGRGMAVLAARTPPSDGDLVARRAARAAEAPGARIVNHEALATAGCATAYLVLGDMAHDGAAMAAAAGAGLPVTLDIGWLPPWLFDDDDTETRAVAAAWLSAMIAAADAVVARGRGYAAIARTYGAAAITIESDEPVPPPVTDDEERAALRRSFRVPDGRRLIVCPGVIDRDPGLPALSSAVAAEGAFILFCGSGPGMPDLVREAAGDRHADAIGFTGPLPPEQRLAALALADVIALPRLGVAANASDMTGGLGVASGLRVPLLVSPEAWNWRSCDPPADAAVFRFADADAMGAALARALARS